MPIPSEQHSAATPCTHGLRDVHACGSPTETRTLVDRRRVFLLRAQQWGGRQICGKRVGLGCRTDTACSLQGQTPCTNQRSEAAGESQRTVSPLPPNLHSSRRQQSFTNAIAVSLQPFCTALESSLSFLASTSSMSITSCLILPCKPRQSTRAMPAGSGVTTPAAEG